MSRPSEALAAHILDRLVDEGLLRPDDVKTTLPKFAGGALTPEEWRLLIEKATPAADAGARP